MGTLLSFPMKRLEALAKRVHDLAVLRRERGITVTFSGPISGFSDPEFARYLRSLNPEWQPPGLA